LFNADAETAILSILLKNPEKIYDVKYLEYFMFSSTPNQHLFNEMETLRNLNYIPEYNLLVAHLNQDQKLDIVGGIDYLNYLYSLTYDVNNFQEFEKIVLNSYKARSLMMLSSKIPDLVIKESDIDGAIDYIRSVVDKLLDHFKGENTVKLTDAMRSAWNRLLALAQSENKIAYTTGLKNLDGATGGYIPGDLWIIAGRPGMGKTAFMCNSILTGIPTLIFSREMSKEILIYRLLSIKTGIPIFNIRFGMVNQKELDQIAKSMEEIKDLPIFIDTSFISDLGYIVSVIRKYKKNYDIKTVHVDYIQLLAERTMESTHELGQISRAFKLLSNDLDMTSILYSQLNRLVELRDDKRPILSDLRQSGNLEEDADLALFLYRDIIYNKEAKDKKALELLIRKHRNGPIGLVNAVFDDDTNRITERI